MFDEADLPRCHTTLEEATRAAAQEHRTSFHPGYSPDAVRRMLGADQSRRYPFRGVLRFDRRRGDGEILHPYAGRRQDDRWLIEMYLPFVESFDVMPEQDFIALPRATAADLRERAQRDRS